MNIHTWSMIHFYCLVANPRWSQDYPMIIPWLSQIIHDHPLVNSHSYRKWPIYSWLSCENSDFPVRLFCVYRRVSHTIHILISLVYGLSIEGRPHFSSTNPYIPCNPHIYIYIHPEGTHWIIYTYTLKKDLYIIW